MSLFDKLNLMNEEDGSKLLAGCCTSTNWARQVLALRPFGSDEDLFQKQEDVWQSLSKNDFLEAFEGHPKIGDVNSLKEKYKNTEELCKGEQSGMDAATDEIINELADLNDKYEERFGHIFIVCATGKSALEMLDILKSRIENDPDEELKIAANEQSKITKIRLEKLL